MTTLTQGLGISDIVSFEENSFYSRESGTVITGADLVAGTVVGKITASGKWAISETDAVDGSEVPSGVLLTKADAASADVPNAIILVRHATVVRDSLTYGATIDDEAKRTTACVALATVGIIARR